MTHSFHAGPLYIAALALVFFQPTSVSCSQPVIESRPLSVTAECRAGYNLISWSVAAGKGESAGYRVYRSLSPGGPYTILCAVFSSVQKSCKDEGVSNGVKYFYIVRGIDTMGLEGASGNEASVTADTVPPSAYLSPSIDGRHFSGTGPAVLEGKAEDGISGVSTVRTALRRNDTMEWWDGKNWKKSTLPVYIESKTGKNGITRWKAPLDGVMWSQATSYYVRVSATDNAGFTLDPSDSTTFQVDTPAELSMSIAAAPASVAVGQVINVSVLVANIGGISANSVQIFPLTVQGNARTQEIGRVQVGAIPSLGPGEFATVSWSFSPTSPGTLVFSTTSSGYDSASEARLQARLSGSNPVKVRKSANLDVSISPLPANIRQGAPILIRMFVANAGESDAQVTSLHVASSRKGALGPLAGPEPGMPQQIRAGETREFLWRAIAALPGEIKLTGRAAGYDESSGLLTTSELQSAGAVGVAEAPGSINLSASVDSVLVKSKVDLVADVRDRAGTPVPGVAVSFRIISGKGRVMPDIAVTDEMGRAQAWVVLGESAGINAVEARVGAVLSAVSIEGFAPGGTGQGLSRSFFDPEKEPLEIKASMGKQGKLLVTVRTLTGETVKVLADREAPTGLSTVFWDGKDGSGKISPNGLYYILIQTPHGTSSRRVSVLARQE